MTVHRRYIQAGVLCGALLLQAALVVGTIWACYGFRYSAFRQPLTDRNTFTMRIDTLLSPGVFERTVGWAQNYRLLPQAYLFGTLYVYRNSEARFAFVNGEYRLTGWWYFFPYTFLVKHRLPCSWF